MPWDNSRRVYSINPVFRKKTQPSAYIRKIEQELAPLRSVLDSMEQRLRRVTSSREAKDLQLEVRELKVPTALYNRRQRLLDAINQCLDQEDNQMATISEIMSKVTELSGRLEETTDLQEAEEILRAANRLAAKYPKNLKVIGDINRLQRAAEQKVIDLQELDYKVNE